MDTLTLLNRHTTLERFSEPKSNMTLAAFNAFSYLPDDNLMKIYYMDDKVIGITRLNKEIKWFVNKVIRMPEMENHYICRYDIGILITDECGYNIMVKEAKKK